MKQNGAAEHLYIRDQIFFLSTSVVLVIWTNLQNRKVTRRYRKKIEHTYLAFT